MSLSYYLSYYLAQNEFLFQYRLNFDNAIDSPLKFTCSKAVKILLSTGYLKRDDCVVYFKQAILNKNLKLALAIYQDIIKDCPLPRKDWFAIDYNKTFLGYLRQLKLSKKPSGDLTSSLTHDMSNNNTSFYHEEEKAVSCERIKNLQRHVGNLLIKDKLWYFGG